MTRPNVLFIACDDMASITHMMNVLMPTLAFPNIARITGQGADFTRAYCTVPICGPARAAVMTGLSPAETGILSNAPRWEWFLRPELLLTYRLRQEGYYLGTIGKIHHGYVPLTEEVHRILYDSPRVEFPRWTPERIDRRRPGMGPNAYAAGTEDQFYDGQVRAGTIRFLQDYDGAKPFWWECGFKAPHTPYDATEEYDALAAGHDVVMPEAWADGWSLPNFADTWIGKKYGETPPRDWSEEAMDHWRASVRNYGAAMLMLDYNLGLVLDALAASRFADNTIVSFYSDHGYHLGDMGRWHKFTLWEQAALAPMAIRVPGLGPQRIDAPVSHHDLMATLLDYCGVSARAGHRGRSLRPFVETGASEAHDRMVPTFWFGCGSGAKGRYRATLSYDGGGEMFDVVADPFCLKNLAPGHPDWPVLRSELIATMRDHGWSVVDEGVVIPAGSQAMTVWGELAQPVRLPAKIIAFWGDISVEGRTPGWREIWLNLKSGDATYRLPPHVRGLRFSGEYTDAVATVLLNGSDNDVDLSITTAARFDIHMGEGDDTFWDDAGNAVTLHAGPGDKVVEKFGRRGGVFHGGVGNSRVTGGPGDDAIHGGYGTLHAFGHGGNDTLTTGHSDVTAWLHDGRNEVLIEGGRNQINPGHGPDRITVRRTGLPQDLRGLDASDLIDLSDFAPLGPPEWKSDNPVTHRLRIADEEIVFRGLPLKVLRARITGYAV